MLDVQTDSTNTVTTQSQQTPVAPTVPTANSIKSTDESFRKVMDKYNPNKTVRENANKPVEPKHIPVNENDRYAEKAAVQKMIKDRLARQGKSFQQKFEEQQRKIEELEAKLTPPEVELVREDFASKAEYDAYLSEQGVKQVRNIARETFNQELTQKEAKEKEASEQREFAKSVNKQVEILFPDEVKRKEAKQTILSWKTEPEVEDFFSTKHGEVFNEVIAESPIGVLITHELAKQYKPNQVNGWVKNNPETFRAKLKQIEKILIDKIRGANKKPAEVVNQEAVNKNTRVLPNTGKISASGKSNSENPKDVLRRVFPNKYR